MRTMLTGILTAVSVALFSQQVVAQSIVETVAKGCEKELDSYCSEVTPGNGRILACLYAHGEKLSGQCEFALYDAAAQLERAVAALTYVANECDEDIDKFCASVEAGEGRILSCLDENSDKIAKRCGQALSDVGLK